ncbi:MAG: SCO family protein [Paracoccus sp.]|jgi:protein SCO1/2|nr:SCO family protein [Paracoccus sp. (in: a-proteobacteria)]
MRAMTDGAKGNGMTEAKIILAAAAAAAVLSVAAAGGAYLALSGSDERIARCDGGDGAGGLDTLGTEFTLTRDDGTRVSDKQVFDRPTLLYFGYTSCPDVCPLDNARNAEAVDILKSQGRDAQSVFVTVDPGRDTPEVLARFADSFGGAVIGLTGSDAEIAAVSKGWRIYSRANGGKNDRDYMVDHASNTYLVMPGNRTVDLFPREDSAEKIAATVGCNLDVAA